MEDDVIVILLNFDELIKNKNLLCYEDFYKETGIMNIVKDISNREGKYHYQNIQANELTIKKIDDILRNNLINTKNKFSKMYKEKYLETVSAMDRLMWSPKIVNQIDENIIKIILPNNKDFAEVKE